MAIVGADIKRLRERRGLSQTELAEILNGLLDKRYSSGSVSPWENDRRTIPSDVASLIEQMLVDTALPGESEPSPDAQVAGDQAPGGDRPPPVVAQPPLTSGAVVYARACAELWEMIGAGVGMAGAATGNTALMLDGQVIVADKEALGKAWGRLAETNETFRKMLASMTEGGAWLQVAVVTGTTVARCYQNHATAPLQPQADYEGHVEREPAAVA
jgi:helix-turn-helix protein